MLVRSDVRAAPPREIQTGRARAREKLKLLCHTASLACGLGTAHVRQVRGKSLALQARVGTKADGETVARMIREKNNRGAVSRME